MVIEGGKGYTGTNGEGGDIYLWAGRGGDSGGTGGDIKIRGGYGYSEGGYIRIDGGDTAAGPGGYVEITGGNSAANNGGEVRIIGGTGANGNGNVRITSSSNDWRFNNNGDTILPNTAYQTISLGASIAGARSFIKYIDDQILLQSGNIVSNTFYTITNQEDSFWETYTQKDVTGGNSAWPWIHSEMSDANTPYVLIETKKLDSPTKTWIFTANGILEVPTTASGWGRVAGDNLVIGGDKDPMYSAYVFLPNNADAYTQSSGIYNASGNVEIGAGGIHYWKFANTGILEMPKAINFKQNATIPLGPPAANGANDRITLWDFEGGGSGYNYAIGVEGNHIWFTMDVNNGTGGFKFYSRDTLAFKIRDNGILENKVLTYSALPAATTAGLRAFISDANTAASGNFGAVISGGGSNNVPVWSDGTNWRIG